MKRNDKILHYRGLS
ncbi:hypothetical protein ACXON2_003569 [Escherichia coli]|nr:hypothetical protein [Escherichia coli]HEI2702957.1 hypothetical protein [Escherichia coli]